MTGIEKQKIEKKLCKKLSLLSHQELREMGINGQQAVKIKNGEIVRFYLKTFRRLSKKVLGVVE